MTETIAVRMASNSRTRGFDYLRLGLALAVAVWHAYFLPTLGPAKATSFGFALDMILPMFFALSGFLVSGSLERTKNIRDFVALRAIRLVPALAVEVALSAFVLGAIFTTVPLGDYFSSPRFFDYLRNVVGDVHFRLPGVFEQNPTYQVNLSLWTVPYELLCYLAIVILWIVRALPARRYLLLAAVIACQVAFLIRDLHSGDLIQVAHNTLPGRMFVLAFLWAVVLYFFRDRIVLRAWLAAAALLACYVLLKTSLGSYFVALPAAYLTVFVGLTDPPKIPVLMDGDYSYGIYLYAAPIQQASIALFPQQQTMWFNLASTLPLVVLFAAFSWHAIEKPILGRRKAMLSGLSRIVVPARFAAVRPR